MAENTKFETGLNIKYLGSDKKNVIWNLPAQSFDEPTEDQAKAIFKYMLQQYIKKNRISEDDVKQWTSTPWDDVVATYSSKAQPKPKVNSFVKHAVYAFRAKRGEKKTEKEIRDAYKTVDDLPEEIKTAVKALM